MKILKFGGTSIGSAERIEKVLDIIQSKAASEDRIAVVFSALGTVTDLLINLCQTASSGDESYKQLLDELEKIHLETADELISLKKRSHILTQIKLLLKDLEEVIYGIYLVKELTVKTQDYIMSFGERLSAFIISECLADRDTANEYVDTREIIKTNQAFGQAAVDFEQTTQNIQKRFKSELTVFIVTGFIASTANNETTTLGRGGSDYSASIFGAILNATEIEIWTDVDGVMTADPRKVHGSFPIPQLTYEEAMELSHFGARVIHPPTMQPALDHSIPLRIKNTFNPSFDGTVISNSSYKNGFSIRGISSIDSVALLQIQGSGMIGVSGIAQRIFSALAREEINIILITQASSEHSICLAIMPECAERAKTTLQEELKYEMHYGHVNEVAIENHMAIIAVVGERMRHTKGIAGKVFQTLSQNNVNISAIAQGSSELNISMVVAQSDETRALNALHSAFFLSESKTINLFLVGTGLVGSTFLNQLKNQLAQLLKNKSIHFQLVGLSNSRKMIFNERGIDLESWEDNLQASDSKSDMEAFTSRIKELSSPNSILLDCTASTLVPDFYADFLASGISIVTANKIANTQSQGKYDLLKQSAQKGNAHFMYSTNVGAGLPFLSTIKSIVSGNDDVVKMEGILSGTLSYIFNSFDGSIPFSELVRNAMEKGYTEPDPRMDLNGIDAARKLQILIRETGQTFELGDISIESFLPNDAMRAETVEEFFKILKKSDTYFRDLQQQAVQGGKVLRFIAGYENGKANIVLTAVDKSHPFYHLSGSDNILSVYTNYYQDQPLVIKGSGAGGEVTAAGVFADVLRISDSLL